jgi:hypothetical protein
MQHLFPATLTLTFSVESNTSSRHHLTPAQEAAVHKMVPEKALAVNESIGFSAD